jgi:hypothetical protein
VAFFAVNIISNISLRRSAGRKVLKIIFDYFCGMPFLNGNRPERP